MNPEAFPKRMGRDYTDSEAIVEKEAMEQQEAFVPESKVHQRYKEELEEMLKDLDVKPQAYVKKILKTARGGYIPERLRETIISRRRYMKLTQRELSERMGVDLSVVIGWEEGTVQPDPVTFNTFRRNLYNKLPKPEWPDISQIQYSWDEGDDEDAEAEEQAERAKKRRSKKSRTKALRKIKEKEKLDESKKEAEGSSRLDRKPKERETVTATKQEQEEGKVDETEDEEEESEEIGQEVPGPKLPEFPDLDEVAMSLQHLLERNERRDTRRKVNVKDNNKNIEGQVEAQAEDMERTPKLSDKLTTMVMTSRPDPSEEKKNRADKSEIRASLVTEEQKILTKEMEKLIKETTRGQDGG
eukprot:CAMPEP_0184482650 /NCGR_PEP_ID=MMETSP0113_2-20130426/4229_1 /TAXON_ID=91329 /ORGANISM="Norrisiella sphaerica, Strain BC52" /LENGTH=356 /DNA_ID=CAMNT_0026862515 /DNA_START=352 /DNA_END=1422 /DNA_ORIENTATION=-